MDNEHQEYLWKILVVGEIGCGKTSIIKRYAHGKFSIHYKSTIGADFALKVVRLNDHTSVRLQMWDIAGQERFGTMTRSYYKDANAAVVVCDVTRQSTWDAVKKWKADLDSKLNTPIPTLLLANKIDLITEDDETWWTNQSQDNIDAFCKSYGFNGWYNTSAKDGVGIENAMTELINVLMNTQTSDLTNTSDIQLDQPNEDEKSCCAMSYHYKQSKKSIDVTM